MYAPGGNCPWDNGDHVYETVLLNDGMIRLLGDGTHAAKNIGLTRFRPGDRVNLGVIEYSRIQNYNAMHQVRLDDGTRGYYFMSELERAP